MTRMQAIQTLKRFSTASYQLQPDIHLPGLRPQVQIPIRDKSSVRAHQCQSVLWQRNPQCVRTVLPNLERKRHARNAQEHHGAFLRLINPELDKNDLPVLFKREAPDRESLIKLGVAMLEAFHDSIDLDGYQIVDVELPLAATLYTDAGEPTDFKLVGVIDLLLMDGNQELLVVDHKTAAQAKSQSTVDEDLQFASYAYLLGANRFVFPTAPVKCRMDVLRKLKTGPKLEHYHTTRTSQDRKRFAKIANAVLMAIGNRVFVPNRSWLCSDCPFLSACQNW